MVIVSKGAPAATITSPSPVASAVEDATGRKVIAFMSQNHIDPDMAAEIFVLEPEKKADGGPPTD